MYTLFINFLVPFQPFGIPISLLSMVVTTMAVLETLAWSVLASTKYFVLITVFGIAVYLIQNEITRYRSRVKNLPGPRGWPVVGNLFQVKYQNMHTYFPIFYPYQIVTTPTYLTSTPSTPTKSPPRPTDNGPPPPSTAPSSRCSWETPPPW